MITSVRNERVKEWRKLHKRKHRYEKKQFLIEGFHLLDEASKSGWDIKEILVEEGVELPDTYAMFNRTELHASVFNYIARTESPQGVMAVIYMNSPEQICGSRILMVDAVQDPGNLGTLIRTADAAGYHSVVLGEGTVDIFNDKVIRATQGSIFHLPVISANLTTVIADLRAMEYHIITSALNNSVPYHAIDVPPKSVLIVGNEGNGINESLLALSHTNIHIPIYGQAESLNVGVAAGILMYYFR